MKNFRLLQIVMAFVILLTSSSQSIAIPGIGKELGEMIAPIARDQLKIVGGFIADGLKKLSQKKNQCQLAMKVPLTCSTEKGLSLVKAACQQEISIDKYVIRVRFIGDVSPIACLRKGIEKGVRTVEGKDHKIFTIAVYSQDQLDDVVEYIANIRAANKVISSNGGVLQLDDEAISMLRKKGTYDKGWTNEQVRKAVVAQRVQDAKELIKICEDHLMSLAKDGRFGPQ